MMKFIEPLASFNKFKIFKSRGIINGRIHKNAIQTTLCSTKKTQYKIEFRTSQMQFLFILYRSKVLCIWKEHRSKLYSQLAIQYRQKLISGFMSSQQFQLLQLYDSINYTALTIRQTIFVVGFPTILNWKLVILPILVIL